MGAGRLVQRRGEIEDIKRLREQQKIREWMWRHSMSTRLERAQQAAGCNDEPIEHNDYFVKQSMAHILVNFAEQEIALEMTQVESSMKEPTLKEATKALNREASGTSVKGLAERLGIRVKDLIAKILQRGSYS